VAISAAEKTDCRLQSWPDLKAAGLRANEPTHSISSGLLPDACGRPLPPKPQRALAGFGTRRNHLSSRKARS
jgi:hypothetical protein